jgi:hypothetical protein
VNLTAKATPVTPASLTFQVGAAQQLVVQVRFGAHLVCEHGGDSATAERYAPAMRRRFAGLAVSVQPSPAQHGGVVPPVPSERLWGLTP